MATSCGWWLRTRSQIKAAETSLRSSGWCRARPWNGVGGLGIWLGYILGASPWRFTMHKDLGGEPTADPESAGGIIYIIWPGNTLWSPRRSWKALVRRRMFGIPCWPCWPCCHCDPTPDKQKAIDGWMDVKKDNHLWKYSFQMWSWNE